MRVIVFCLYLCLSMSVFATDIYRSESASGLVTFSDKASANAKRIELDRLSKRYKVFVKRVIDGDTIEISTGQRLRFIGINTPEISNRYHDAESGGESAKHWLQKQLTNKAIFIEYDQQQQDKYQRLLTHVFLNDGTYLNALILRKGLGMLTLTPPNLLYADLLIKAQKDAEEKEVGVWTLKPYQQKKLSLLAFKKSYRGWQRLKLTIKSVVKTKNSTLLKADKRFAIRINNEDLPLFTSLERYEGKVIEVRGWVHRRVKQYSMLIRHPSAIKLLN
ncbi:MAG TPA: nuclease [Methylophaga aminisulfidivorans]|nr:nuclease [Methylophaga aminisulfidivorans]